MSCRLLSLILITWCIHDVRSFGLERIRPADVTWPPEFCNGFECPRYTLKEVNENYEVRHYEATTWVSTDVSADEGFSGIASALVKLVGYFSGQNQQNKTVTMAMPVLIRVTDENIGFVLSLFLTPSDGIPPKPNDPKLRLSQLQEFTVFVRSFGGFATEAAYKTEAQTLITALEADGSGYSVRPLYAAGYDPPYKLWSRHNEVWFTKVPNDQPKRIREL